MTESDKHPDAALAAASALPAEQAGRFARAKGRSVFIATPVARNPVRQYTLSMIDTVLMLDRLGIRCRLQWVVGNSNLARARNELVAEFLAGDYTDLLWIDDDMGWKARDVVRLLASDKDVIGGVGRKKVSDAKNDALDTWCVRFMLDRDVNQDDMGAIEVLGVGTGFCKISRPVFEALIAAHPEMKRPGLSSMAPEVRDHFYRLYRFADDDGDPLQMSEDFAFCAMWRALGGTVWADPTIELVHVGEREFTGTFAAVLQPAEAREAP